MVSKSVLTVILSLAEKIFDFMGDGAGRFFRTGFVYFKARDCFFFFFVFRIFRKRTIAFILVLAFSVFWQNRVPFSTLQNKNK